ncbi:MAG TPA: anti-CBASS Acb1 family protein [Stellaceae bacterium]|nr:anti-CBASS Acb1 family protein [Stellaceae bacterium]
MTDTPISSATVNVGTTSLGSSLSQIMLAEDIEPGAEPSYQLCKLIYLYHVLGAKMAEAPIRLAQSQDRIISVPTGPEEVLIGAFNEEWKRLEASRNIFNVRTQSRVYGLSSIAVGVRNQDPKAPLKLADLYQKSLYFNVFDPLNTSGLIVDQDPNSPSFQKPGDIMVNGQRYHRSRTRTLLNEESIYIAWTSSAFAYAGRSVYQRALYPLKSFLNSMIADDMVARKVGLLIAKIDNGGSIVDRVMKAMMGVKRALLKSGETGQVLGIGLDESIETLNLQNLDGPHGLARNNIIKNIATAAGMPAKLLTQEAFVEGFGEGTEDAKAVAQYVDRERIEMAPVYEFFDEIAMRRAWTPELYETIQNNHPGEYAERSYSEAFQRWRGAFKATWPSLIKEPPSEEVNVDDVKLRGMIATVQVLAPILDPFNQVKLLTWAEDNLNTHERLFEGSKLVLDFDALREYLESRAAQGQPTGEESALGEEERDRPGHPFASQDSANVAMLNDWLTTQRGRAHGEARR